MKSTTHQTGISLPKSMFVALLLSTLANLVLLSVGKPFTQVPATFATLSVGPVTAWSILGALGASLVYALVRKYAVRSKRTFTIIALCTLVLSFIPDLMLLSVTSGMFAGATWSAVMLLMLMHVVEAIITISVLVKLTRDVSE